MKICEKDYFKFKYNIPDETKKGYNRLTQKVIFFSQKDEIGLVTLSYKKGNFVNTLFFIELKKIKNHNLTVREVPVLHFRKIEKTVVKDYYENLYAGTYVIQNDNPSTVKGEYSLMNNVVQKGIENISIECGLYKNDIEEKSSPTQQGIMLRKIKHNDKLYFYKEISMTDVSF